MATYYVRNDGSDGNAGTGPAAANAWLTIGKALGASGIASGDTVWIAPGTYREVVTVAMTSAVAETVLKGDPSASQFSDIAPGPVVWTGYTTNDTTTPSTTPLLNLNGRDFLTFQDLVLIGSNISGSVILATTQSSTDIVLRRCAVIGSFVASASSSVIQCTLGANVAANWVIDSCLFMATPRILDLTCVRPTGADFDVNFQIKNSFLLCHNIAINVATSGGNTFKPGGVDVIGCTIMAATAVQASGANISTSIPCTVVSSVLCAFGGATVLISGASGSLVENYNYFWATTLRSNVGIGANSQVVPTYAPLVEIGQSWLHGFMPRPFMMPTTGSPLLGFGDDGTLAATDALNRPRPAGGNSTSKGVGYLERHDTAIKETTTTDAGSVAVVIVGPGDHDFKIPIDAASTTISVKARYDATHNTTNKPQAILLANDAIGVATETKTMTAAVDTWDTLTFTPFTPSAKGVVTVRLVSRAAAANGKAFFDTFAVS